ncbi:hypothetical protein ALP54_200001 [Pseudomonas amygdali pv. lachrymans]|nr:hypothetical protein ALP54_200001 [Pseudomonas amygdali pv. lachrymans]
MRSPTALQLIEQPLGRRVVKIVVLRTISRHRRCCRCVPARCGSSQSTDQLRSSHQLADSCLIGLRISVNAFWQKPLRQIIDNHFIRASGQGTRSEIAAHGLGHQPAKHGMHANFGEFALIEQSEITDLACGNGATRSDSRSDYGRAKVILETPAHDRGLDHRFGDHLSRNGLNTRKVQAQIFRVDGRYETCHDARHGVSLDGVGRRHVFENSAKITLVVDRARDRRRRNAGCYSAANTSA